jgi:hypothetical protein
MFSPFGIERQVGEDSPLARAYDVLAQLSPLILAHQDDGTMKAVIVEPGTGSQKVRLGNYVFDFAMGRGWGAPPQFAPGPTALPAPSVAGVPQIAPVAVRRPPLPDRGYAIVIQTGPEDFWVAGANLNIKLASTLAAAPMASLAAVEEGKFENGAWVVGRHLAGDDTGMGGDDRASLRLRAEPGILRVSLYSYR